MVQLSLIIVDMFLLLFLFSYISGQKLITRTYLIAILANLFYSIIFSFIPNNLFSYLIGPTYFLIFFLDCWKILQQNVKNFLRTFSNHTMEFNSTLDYFFHISFI